jgi:hypothetical protein
VGCAGNSLNETGSISHTHGSRSKKQGTIEKEFSIFTDLRKDRRSYIRYKMQGTVVAVAVERMHEINSGTKETFILLMNVNRCG